ncbi:nitroreductase [Achromobacter xylosoxidans]|uniref:Nitroreductase n=1 Tax=Alcaligenes xylosoxydans xylosoxydans TaxID=85698 RepID=A0A9X3L0D1_ALCXX|nr:nitroreductase [Achromobacter xylosoxidans]MCZ8403557.1 nitroreductase [Achromobacter xylosoxidans]BEG77067.1 Nitroreductase NfnB [Achromobacter xylosoxidans]
MSAVPESAAARPDAALEDWLRARHSCRAFLPEPVPRATIERILTLAQRTASWCNCQPWQVTVASGDGARRLSRALVERAARSGFTPDFPFPREYRGDYLARRRESGFQLYGAVGVARGDREAYRRQELRNFQLFDAPHVAIITTDEALGEYGAIDCGGYVANFLLAAQANGVATVAQASLAMYPEVLREQLGVGADRRVVCAISFGYADAAHPANSYRTSRADLDATVRWVD